MGLSKLQIYICLANKGEVVVYSLFPVRQIGPCILVSMVIEHGETGLQTCIQDRCLYPHNIKPRYCPQTKPK